MEEFTRSRHRVGLVAAASAACVAASGIAAVATAQAATAGCRVTYTIGAQWAGGFTANVALTNLGDPVTGWTLRWSFSGGQTVTQAWNATATQSGSAVSVSNASWNGSLATNGNTSFGFNGASGASNPVPTSFTLNGVACTGGVTATPSTSLPASATPSPTVTPTAPGTPPVRTVRVFWLKPTDVAFDQRYPSGITDVMVEAQRFYKQQLGKTFTLKLPDATSTDGTCMSASFYGYPNCTFNPTQKNGILNGPYGAFLS